jgi:glycerol uptake facilitator protein
MTAGYNRTQPEAFELDVNDDRATLAANSIRTQSIMSPFVGEVIGTMLLVLLGDGVVANVLLNQSKGQNGGWIVITAGWGSAVTVGVYSVGWASGGHLNPAVTVGLAGIGQFAWAMVPAYILAQMIGAFLGAILVWLVYLPHWGITPDKAAVRGVFCTAPAVRKPFCNLLTEIIGTFVLMVGVLAIPSVNNLDPASGFAKGLGPLLVGLLVFSIGLSLGGPTGYAINPARDLGPRLAHAVLPIQGKLDSDWSYAWVPIIGPLIGGLAGAVFYKICWAV